MIDVETRAELFDLISQMSNEDLLKEFKSVNRVCREMVNEIGKYVSDETYDNVKVLVEAEYKRSLIVDRLIGKVAF